MGLNDDVLTVRITAIEKLADERDKWYIARDKDRHDAVTALLLAAKDSTAQAFQASKEAVSEAKKSQDAYNLTHNDLVRKMERQTAESMSRIEIEGRLVAITEKLEVANKPIVEFMAQQLGTRTGMRDGQYNLGWVVALIVSLLAIGSFVFRTASQPIIAAPPYTISPTQPK